MSGTVPSESGSKSSPDPAPKTHHRAKTFWSVVCITVACLLAPLSVVAVWARGEVTDTDRYVATVAPLASDPAIQQAVSDRVSNEILQRLDVKALTSELIGTITTNRSLTARQTAALTALAGPVDSGIEGFIRDKVTQVVQSPQFAALWTQANTRAHAQINAALSGETTGAVQIQGNEVVLDLGEVVAQVKAELVNDGFTVAEKIPTVDTQMVLVESNSISRAQKAYSTLNTLGFWLPVVAVVLALIGVFVAHDRRKGLLGFGIGLTLTMVVSGIAFGFVRTDVLNQLPPSANTAAATALLDQVSHFLRQALWAGATAGVVLILAAIFIGPSRAATGVRDLASRGAGAVQRTGAMRRHHGLRPRLGGRTRDRSAGCRLDRGHRGHHAAALQDRRTHHLVHRGAAGGALCDPGLCLRCRGGAADRYRIRRLCCAGLPNWPRTGPTPYPHVEGVYLLVGVAVAIASRR